MPGRETGMMQRLRQSWRRAGSPSVVLAGYSGGADSLALLWLLRELSRLEGISLHAVHVDHAVRPESAADAKAAEANAVALGVPLVVERFPDDPLTQYPDVGPEEGMRRARYLIFSRLAGELGAVLAVGHHRRDQAETVLLHVLRGAGLDGVAGMQEVSLLEVPWWEDGDRRVLSVWRPLLNEAYRDVQALARESGLTVIEDPSNSDLGYRRNAIRHRVLPEMEAAFPGAEATLARFAGLAAIDAEELDRQADAALESVLQDAGLVRHRLMALRPAIRSRVVRRWLVGGMPPGVEVSANRVEELLTVAASSGPLRRVEIAGGRVVEVSRDELRLVHADGPHR